MGSQIRIGVTSSLAKGAEPPAGSEVAMHADLLRRYGAQVVFLARGYDTASAFRDHYLDGILFSGGGDIAPERYGGRSDLTDGRVDSVRDEGEINLIRAAYVRRLPMLCVCRGLQLANVAFGGTLIEDLPSEMGEGYCGHHQIREHGKDAGAYTHEVVVTPASAFERVVRLPRFWTNSVHHQAVRSLAPPFRVAAASADAVIEAIEPQGDGQFFLGVQWHPEALPSDDLASNRIYEAFTSACLGEVTS